MPTWILIAISICCWGFWAVAEKLALRHTTPLSVILVGLYVFSGIAPFLFLYMKHQNLVIDWNPKGVFWSTVTALLSTIAGISFVHAINRVPAHVAIGFTAVYPILSFILCVLVLNEPITLMKYIGIVTVVIGTIFLSL